MRSLILAALMAATPLAAQEAHRHTGARAVLSEVGAGAIGSFSGFLPVVLMPSCVAGRIEDRPDNCNSALAVGVLLVSPVGTAFGVSLAARHNSSKRSVVGAWVGGVAGGLVGLSLAGGLEMRGAGPALTFPTYCLVQASMSAIGSRVLGRR